MFFVPYSHHGACFWPWPKLIIEQDRTKLARETAERIKDDLSADGVQAGAIPEVTNQLLDGLTRDAGEALDGDGDEPYMELERDSPIHAMYGQYVQRLSDMLPEDYGLQPNSDTNG